MFSNFSLPFNKVWYGNALEVQWLGLSLPKVQSLVGELKSHDSVKKKGGWIT